MGTHVAALDLTPAAPGAHAPLQDALERAVNNAGAPGIVAEVIHGRSHWSGSAGLSDTATGQARTSDEQFRIGSATKAFTATVVLQLAAERRIGLDDTVERWLPGLVQGNGYDGRAVTIRQLLNQTSGIFAYTNAPEFFVNGIGANWYEHRHDRYTPEQLVKVALAHPPYAAPGERFGYSNTNFLLAAMIVEKVTGRTFAQEIDRRIVRPLDLTGTYLPATGDAGIRGPHPVHYSTLFSADPNPRIHDATEMDQSYAWSAGGLVSTTGDLTRFFGALFGGRLLPAEQMSEMLTTVDTDGSGWIPATRYGLGVFAQTLGCGVTVWGNGGATYGSWSYTMGTRDGRHVLAIHVNGDWSGLPVFDDVLNAEFCPEQ
ncbi:serine hydrolase domain-containing protein [Micromonospora sp. C28SCA-DRY-2]|uniref:serine hydrolase domain-containing protein n=1 Tax=Micromonospora sp. C28SCA-DRY-2 TaxID=3059522 RepID=UPI00267766D4|nr:serine hydrolase domain-containing protein [Micromonospora sp. C28SCA-DRY-2]MDO3700270.1 serine hydrolase domain-containing protein [Micromonospora sp. C28SCA-DRY-2]